jgi:pimeloyl-ACP methyl ester carboxylesterase
MSLQHMLPSVLRFTRSGARSASTLSHTITKKDEAASPTKTLLVLHGILGNKKNLRSISKNIVTRFPQWQIINIDHRGHGQSPSMKGPHTLAACASDVIELCDSLLVAPDMVVGHSFGSKVALSYLEETIKRDAQAPSHVWLLDSIPGLHVDKPNDSNSVGNVRPDSHCAAQRCTTFP